MVAFIVSTSALVGAISYEVKKRKSKKASQGKTLFMETARKKKSKTYITVTSGHLLTSLLTSSLYRSIRLLHEDTNKKYSFALILTGLILITLQGFFNVVIYISTKKILLDDGFAEILERHSLRQSIKSIHNVPLVTGGYKPKTSLTTCATNTASANTTDFGIFIGGEDEDEDETYSPNVSFKRPLCDSACRSQRLSGFSDNDLGRVEDIENTKGVGIIIEANEESSSH